MESVGQLDEYHRPQRAAHRHLPEPSGVEVGHPPEESSWRAGAMVVMSGCGHYLSGFNVARVENSD